MAGIYAFFQLASHTTQAQVILSPVERIAPPANAAAMGFTRPGPGENRNRYDTVFNTSNGWSGTHGRFGHRIAIHGDRMIVSSLAKGAVYLYTRQPGGPWQFDKFIYRWVAGNPAQDIAIADNFIMLGDPDKTVFASGVGQLNHGGAFLMPIDSMDQNINKIVADSEGGISEYSIGHENLTWVGQRPGWLLGDTTQSAFMNGSRFGAAVAWNGEIAIAGAPNHKTSNITRGAVWLWDYATTTTPFRSITSATRLTPQHTLDANAGYGSSVASRPGLIAIGAPGQGTKGSAFLFGKTDALWDEMYHFQGHSSLPANARYGTRVAVSGNTLAVSAPGPLEDGGTLQTGRVFIYNTIDPDNPPVLIDPPETAFRFGASLALEGNRLLVGSWGGSSGSTGAAYLYQRDSLGTWHYKAKLFVPSLPVGSRFGYSVVLSGDDAHVTSLTDSTDGENMGGVYRFDLSDISTEADLTVSFPDPAPYNGQARPVQFTIFPNTLPVTISYGGSSIPPINAGTTEVTVSFNQPGYAPITITGTIVITQAEDQITFPNIPVLYAGDPNYNISFPTASGRAPSFTSSQPSILSANPAANTLSPLAVGTSLITATLPETQNYTAATASGTVIVDDFRAVGSPPQSSPSLPAGSTLGLDQLGARVAIGTDYAAASRRKVPDGPRPVSVFRRLRNGQWVHFTDLPLPMNPNNQYGHRLAVAGDIIAVGDASWANHVHIYEITSEGGIHTTRIPGGQQVSEMGWREIALSNDGRFLFASVKRGTSDPSGVRVYRRDGRGQWALHQTIASSQADTPGAYFGWSLATTQNLLAISNPNHNAGNGLVATYQLNPQNNLWSHVHNVIHDISSTFSFGSRIDLQDHRLLVSNSNYNGYGDGREGRVLIYPLEGEIPNSPVNLFTPEEVIGAPASAVSFGKEAAFFGGRVAVKYLNTSTGDHTLGYFRKAGVTWEAVPAPALGDFTSFNDETTLASSTYTTLMVGLPRDEADGAPEGSGKVVFLTTGNEALVTQGITPTFQGASTNSQVATFGQTIAFGADIHTEPTRFGQGKVLIFEAYNGFEKPTQEIIAGTPRQSGFFGRTLTLGGTHLVVAQAAPAQGGLTPVELDFYRRDISGAFAHVQTIVSNDFLPGGAFTPKLAINDAPGNRALALALGGASAVNLYSFDETTGLWSFAQRIADSSLGGYGASVAIFGNNLVIGGTGAAASDVGRTDLYRRNPGTGVWSFMQSLPITNPPGTFSSFQSRNHGRAVAIGSDFIAVTANQGTSPLNTRLHFYRYTESTSATHHYSVTGSDQFGANLAAAGPYLIASQVGASGSSGRGILYTRENSFWEEVGRVDGPPGLTTQIGFSVSVGSRFAVAGGRLTPGVRETAFRMIPLSNPSFSQWAQAFDLVGSNLDPLGDPTGEGLPNLLRHVFGIPANTPMDAAQRETLPRITTTQDGDTVYTFTIPESIAEDIPLIIQKSSTLGGAWQVIARRLEGQWIFEPSLPGTTTTENQATRVEFVLDPAADPKCFYRVVAPVD